ncbi:MBL fold metallo-hydrolase [Haloarchaeobius litoreus]|uniref:MBL fold metallo-hydrolase n=1 Tax=Haloarchaeobius litoreus TaxID=755306 RepID=A0ABD6DHQ8_9EURY|nr:MBL fold metallo-hydrolase [Haloarchaeobius litoreus]
MPTRLPAGVTHVDCRTRDRPNVYLVDDGDLTLVDAGWPGDATTVRAGVEGAGFDLADVDRVLLTHYDADHVGGLAGLTPDLDAPVFVHEREAAYVAGDDLPPWTARNGLEALHRLYYRRLDLPDLPIRAVRDGDTVAGFTVHHTPGHTPGHVAYVHEGTQTVFLGDLVYGLGDELRPTGRFTSYDAAQVRESIRSLCEALGDVRFVCPGHGPPLAGGRDLLARSLG